MTHFKQLSEVLRNYYDIPDQELDKINSLFYPCKLKKGEYFVRSGYMADSIGFIVTGLLRYFYTDKNGVEYTKAFAAENDFAVSYASMLLKKPSAFQLRHWKIPNCFASIIQTGRSCWTMYHVGILSLERL
ncbi:MAG TPA: cyclic nucleotide-binding domain-containing protein [Bacillota bacterium]|nr:cyclic nucleotide-binding domain-containing protein [Clostridiaceae bacterium]HNR04330.1 cyclic nucleotide-binding domain-containing protein [Bacillota bacterium]HNT03673.1 cyclic nucleotide-binding domain-containing protein [Bacillota bacterium]HNU80502.1 cyclic nucleotide-binding domain-containing protein [Bacillota bacterium]HOH89432.1 cyclic nucleotide-binding domain-containing protein [Bacillota bacterium]